ncbi:MAG: DUF3048 domain-containing protein [Acidimicrobiales bacterium]
MSKSLSSSRQPGSTRRRTAGAALAAAALVTAACGGGGGDDADKVADVDQTSTTVPADPAPAGGPLTGLPIEAARAGRPALIVKIDNAPKGRPQAGINQADVVLEEMVEGGITRLAVVFHSQEPASVGPIRSARTTDILFGTALNHPLFAYSGANANFAGQVASSALVDVGQGKSPGDYRREKDRPQTYDLFSSVPKLYDPLPIGAGPPPPLFRYRPEGQPSTAAGAANTAGVTLTFKANVRTEVAWAWDAGSGTWTRKQNGTAHVDADGAQVAPRNVVVQFVSYRDTGQKDRSGAVVPEANLIGEGDVWVFTDGKVTSGRWKKASPEAVTEYLDSAGEPIALTAGQTWLELPQPGSAELAG